MKSNKIEQIDFDELVGEKEKKEKYESKRDGINIVLIGEKPNKSNKSKYRNQNLIYLYSRTILDTFFETYNNKTIDLVVIGRCEKIGEEKDIIDMFRKRGYKGKIIYKNHRKNYEEVVDGGLKIEHIGTYLADLSKKLEKKGNIESQSSLSSKRSLEEISDPPRYNEIKFNDGPFNPLNVKKVAYL